MKLAIYGYGNLGRGVELAIRQNKDSELVGIFTRRDPSAVKPRSAVPVYPADEVRRHKENVDVLILCGGSATDLPVLTPALAEHFNVVDSFDTHAKIPAHFEKVDAAAKKGGKLALISAGWDPGLFSLNRLYGSAILPEGNGYTFWGRGVSQGHSDAVRRIPGVKDARQYTVPSEEALRAVRAGENPVLTAYRMHKRVCYVAAKADADRSEIERRIKEMPFYFADYDTTVHFVTEEELQRDHSELPHGGFVLRSGVTGEDGRHRQLMEYRLTLDSNPEFTACALVAFSRAVFRMAKRGAVGCKTVFDIAPADLSAFSAEELREKML